MALCDERDVVWSIPCSWPWLLLVLECHHFHNTLTLLGVWMHTICAVFCSKVCDWSSSFLLFNMSPSIQHTFIMLIRLASWSSLLTPKITMSSCISITPGHCSRMTYSYSWKTSCDILAPNSIQKKHRQLQW